jgi:hypothetical protein
MEINKSGSDGRFSGGETISLGQAGLILQGNHGMTGTTRRACATR